ncbi:DNA primase family protein [Hominifimenecus sp. rT4P-3]|uniref:DNA primase family protein n=1 Tax=Hominifimenecus sp. rT4P-3 TaxID=3242979 RepID=UPI003DA45A8D
MDILEYPIAEYLKTELKIIVIAGKPYIYYGGYYKLDEDGAALMDQIKALIFPELISVSRIKRVYDLLIKDYALQKEIDEVNRHPKYWINFRNGMFDVKEWKMHEHDPKYLSINQIPSDFIQNAPYNGSTAEKFISDLVPNQDDQEMLFEWFGYCMTVDTSFQKYLTFNGPPGAGKSVILWILEQIVGKENVCSISLQDLNKRFYPTNLFGKLLNVCADIPSTALEQVDVIKKITGEDAVMGEYKGGKVFKFHPYAKQSFSANEIPINRDEKSRALYRRMLILKTEGRGEYIENLKAKLALNLPAIIYKSVVALKRAYENGCLTESEQSKAEILELYKASDSVMAFLADCTEQREGAKIERKKLYDLYTSYTEEEGVPFPYSKTGFFANLRKKGYAEITVKGVRYFKGIEQKFEEKDLDGEPFKTA